MSTRGGGEARQATVKIIETVHVEVDRYSFKSIVQRLTGRDALVGDYSEGPERRSNEEAPQRAAAGYMSNQASKPFADRHSSKDESC
ncbi:hypothetical protein BDA96_03G260700 [Sorghum bicolor]|jgi:hypothetical protein|uniref:VQ domain-containing protein n=2 Tax=Sorghum bicolor TaxID=4558 RepID=A0A921RG96_SORBI|nr:uncharacterized protein LOC110433535 [Sorghum bicolor]KAG0538717.1 hypothetical protein BDA96_03G260700 [Sorghum bicolor]KXG33008.1 hypothetical protein SORBI_3003G240600 [Sorghum bicolor]|eukprot:XP_021311548.1 uncharacterized protein LOC110433535 [Sorghum bicolor]